MYSGPLLFKDGYAQGRRGSYWGHLYVSNDNPDPPRTNSRGDALVSGQYDGTMDSEGNFQWDPSSDTVRLYFNQQFIDAPDLFLDADIIAAGGSLSNYSPVSTQLAGPGNWFDEWGIVALAGAAFAGAAAISAGAVSSGAAVTTSAGSIASDMSLTGAALSDSIIAEMGGTGAIGDAVAGTYGATAGTVTAANVVTLPANNAALADSIISEAGAVTSATAPALVGSGAGVVEIAKNAVSAINSIKSAAGALATVMGVGAVKSAAVTTPRGLTNQTNSGTQSTQMSDMETMVKTYWPVLAVFGVVMALKG